LKPFNTKRAFSFDIESAVILKASVRKVIIYIGIKNTTEKQNLPAKNFDIYGMTQHTLHMPGDGICQIYLWYLY
jgi:hypothetical protein